MKIATFFVIKKDPLSNSGLKPGTLIYFGGKGFAKTKALSVPIHGICHIYK